MDEAKRKAAEAAVEEFVVKKLVEPSQGQGQGRRDFVIGIGSGSTVVFMVQSLAKVQKAHENIRFICIPTSFQAQQLILENDLELGDLNRFPSIDVAIDGADEVDEALHCIKGGGGCLLQEKIVAAAAKEFVLICDHSKDSKTLGEKWKKGVPIEVLALSYNFVMRKIRELGGEPKLRMAVNKVGPELTDNGNFLVDATFGLIQNPAELNQKLISIPGVLETGLFISMAQKAFFGQADGSVISRLPPGA